MHSDTLNIGKQLLVQLMHMAMMSNMLAYDSHLSASDTCTNIAQSIVVAYMLVLIIRI